MSLRIESIQSDASILIVETKNRNNSYSFSGYSETWKKIWECIRPILITLSCGAWKPDPFIQVSCQGKTVYILPDQIKESYKKLHVALPVVPITEETLARWVLSVGFLPVSTTPNAQPPTLPSTSSASDSTSTQQPSQEPQLTPPKILETESLSSAPAPSDSSTPIPTVSPSSSSSSSSSSAVSSSSESSQSIVAASASSTCKPEDLAISIIDDPNFNRYDDYLVFFDFHINKPFESYKFMEKVKFIYALLSNERRKRIYDLLIPEACAHIVTKIINTTSIDEPGLDESDLEELMRYTKLGNSITGHVRAAAFRILLKKDPSISDTTATLECFAADRWKPYWEPCPLLGTTFLPAPSGSPTPTSTVSP